MHRQNTCIVVVMGVSGAGKTTVGRALAHRLGWRFLEGDDLHPPANVAKMRDGQPLDDNDRAPWLAAIATRIDEWRRDGECGVVACSALKRRYRDVLIGDRADVRLVFLDGKRDLLIERLSARRGHFMPVSLLDSQLATLEPPTADEHAVTVPIALPVAHMVDAIAAQLAAPAPSMTDGVEKMTAAHAAYGNSRPAAIPPAGRKVGR